MHFDRKHTQEDPSSDIRNANKLFHEQMTVGERAADKVAGVVGSWAFIIIQSIMLAIWVVLNTVAWIQAWDPYPFILMNLVLSTQAAFTAPIIMMSQNRQAIRDRVEAHNDYLINVKSEQEIHDVIAQLQEQNQKLQQIIDRLTLDAPDSPTV
ncbi:DUF1003 domain-containing protein [Phototrophicus methaneseepsis]|uniref:DUF1003 domain-containing protein n=1 Tax=Phototrophicus methaneseepsis TaxID=2710758 RepID=A0A7S8E6Z0_9CHLR|nr:DUF1003 domain-containing protein [Phototrophicus methaneseepsis]QPC81504.1 DUF1003 domain-containing protein [Phototrophicus methaneseepsis]